MTSGVRTSKAGSCVRMASAAIRSPSLMPTALSVRLLLGAENRRTERARIMEAAFRAYGLQLAIRTDNGPTFAGHGLAGLSTLLPASNTSQLRTATRSSQPTNSRRHILAEPATLSVSTPGTSLFVPGLTLVGTVIRSISVFCLKNNPLPCAPYRRGLFEVLFGPVGSRPRSMC